MSNLNLPKLQARLVLCMQQINYRMMQKSALPLKVELLHGSTINDSSDVFGWREEYPMEVVEIDCPALYMNPHLKEKGIFDKGDLIASYKTFWQGELARAKSDENLPKHYAEVCQQRIDTDPTHVTIGGIHRGSVFPTVLAMWMDNGIKFTDEIPVVVGKPTTYQQLQTMQHRRNAEGASQVELTDVDILVSAVDAIGYGKSNSEFKHFIAVGQWPAPGQAKEQGKAIQRHWYVALLARSFPKLKILERIQIDPDTSIEADRKRRIELKCIKYMPKFGGLVKFNVMRVLFCADPVFRADYRASAQGKSAAPTGSEEERIEQGLAPSWDEARVADWVDHRCPASGLKDAGSVTVDVKPLTVSVERVSNLSRSSDSEFFRDAARSLLVDPNVEDGDRSGAFGEMLKPIAPAIDAAYRMLRHPALVGKATQLLINLDAIVAASNTVDMLRLLDNLNELVSKPKASEVTPAPSETSASEVVDVAATKSKGKKQPA